MSSTSLDAREADLASAHEILTRLERYAATHRPVSSEALVHAAPVVAGVPSAPERAIAGPSSDEHLPAARRRIQPTTVDLFPYDLSASVVGCAATIMAYLSFGRPIALTVTAGLIAVGVFLRQRRWFPSVGVNLVIGTAVGILFVFTA